ncbi:hypothetical protein HWV62_29483 [Athelia sp. TMB]|nr:hypothetical protein HWV62_29483 [Athelia sp. TMB]
MAPLPRILICGDLVWAHAEAKEMFAGIAETILMTSANRDQFLKAIAPNGAYYPLTAVYRNNTSADRIGVFDAPIIAALATAGVRWIAHNGAGYDQIDILACIEQGIKVSNTPGAVDDATATTAFYLMISALRQFSNAERSLREGKWKGLTNAGKQRDAEGKTLAILGLGGIGLRLAELARAFPMRILYHSRHPNPSAPEWAEYFPTEKLYEMLAQADVLSVHVPLRTETEGLVGESMIRALKKGGILVNTARGKVVDEEAMIRALEDGHLASAALDVYPDEPAVNPRLLSFPQNVLLPHMGTETRDSQRKMEVRALGNVRDFLKKGKGNDLVPEMKLKEPKYVEEVKLVNIGKL